MPGRIYHATMGRFIPAVYDRFVMRPVERAGLTAQRRALLGRARGTTLELGAGTGLNLGHYPPSVTELVLTEPSDHMARHLRARVAESGRAATVIETPGERLPFEDDHFDTVAATLVLCTAEDPVAVLRETARVLRPGGRFLFLEHVRSGSAGLARWQDRLAVVWPYLADGCHPNRDTLATLEASALEVEAVEHGQLNKVAPLIRPTITGTATPGAGDQRS